LLREYSRESGRPIWFSRSAVAYFKYIESEDIFGEDRQIGNGGRVGSKTVQLPNGRLHILSVFRCIYKGDKNSENLLPFHLNIWYVLEQVRSREYSRVGVQTSIVAALVMLNTISFMKRLSKHCE
jgi:hypothetical protein